LYCIVTKKTAKFAIFPHFSPKILKKIILHQPKKKKKILKNHIVLYCIVLYCIVTKKTVKIAIFPLFSPPILKKIILHRPKKKKKNPQKSYCIVLYCIVLHCIKKNGKNRNFSTFFPTNPQKNHIASSKKKKKKILKNHIGLYRIVLYCIVLLCCI